MSFAPFVLVTGSHGKIAEARIALGLDVEAVEMDLPEIQGLNVLDILQEKAEVAWKRVQRPLVVEEACLGLLALNGFPGPLIKWMLVAVGAEGIARVAHALGNDRAVARCALLYKDAERTLIADGITTGTLVLPGRGEHGFGWDPVFLPDGETRTFAELTGREKDAVSHRGKACRDLLSRLKP
jgi:non-canonical purine NTP pyrophosphatase (RdgB/HAM1 family)